MAIDPYKRRQQRLDAKRGARPTDDDTELGLPPGLPRFGRGSKFLLAASIFAAVLTIGAVFWDRESVKRADGPDPANAAQVQLGRSLYFALAPTAMATRWKASRAGSRLSRRAAGRQRRWMRTARRRCEATRRCSTS